jgi:TRAP-type C4-dicarboxylate transport system permease small subunit
METMRSLLKWLWRLEATVCVVTFSLTALALMADVLSRELLGDGIFGAQRFAVWTTAIAGLLGFALVTAENGHLRPQFADKWIPAALEPHMDRIGELLSMSICLFLGWYAIGFVQSSMALGERGMAIPIKVWPIQTVLIWMFFSSALRHATFAIWPALRPEAKGESH